MSIVPLIRSIPFPAPPALRRARGRGAAAVAMGREALLFLGAALAYFGVRGLTEGSAAAARENAELLVAAEEAFGLAQEPALQGLIIDAPALVTLANWVYIWGHWPLIAAVAVWLYLRRPEGYRLMRNAIFAAGAIGIVIFAVFPVMPPRLGVMEVVDTVTANSQSYRALQPPGLVNQFAAFPSLHAGFNLIVAAVLWREGRTWPLRLLAVVSVAGMSAAVVLTANHYLIDVPAGMAVALAGFALASALPRLRLAGPSEAPARLQPRVLDLDAAIHDHRQTGRAGGRRGRFVDDAQLQPQCSCAGGDRLVDDRGHVLRPSEDIDDPQRAALCRARQVRCAG